MAEIQRYSISGSGALIPYNGGGVVHHAESEAWHLTDKKAALDKQAEEHTQKLHDVRSEHESRMRREQEAHKLDLTAQAEELKKLIRAFKQAAVRLKAEHAKELAEVREERDQLIPGESSLNRLRHAGWTVNTHRDFVKDGTFCTFWRLVKGFQILDGEGSSDRIALEQCKMQLQAIGAQGGADDV